MFNKVDKSRHFLIRTVDEYNLSDPVQKGRENGKIALPQNVGMLNIKTRKPGSVTLGEKERKLLCVCVCKHKKNTEKGVYRGLHFFISSEQAKCRKLLNSRTGTATGFFVQQQGRGSGIQDLSFKRQFTPTLYLFLHHTRSYFCMQAEKHILCNRVPVFLLQLLFFVLFVCFMGEEWFFVGLNASLTVLFMRSFLKMSGKVGVGFLFCFV